MMSTPISRWPVPEIKDLPEDLRARILDVQAKAGFVPNVFSPSRTAPKRRGHFSPGTTRCC
jgi:hypothetical protein